MTKAEANEAFVKKVQSAIGVNADGWAGQGTDAAWDGFVANHQGYDIIPMVGNSMAIGAVDADANDAILAQELERDEGFVPHAYKDSLGFLTIGIGRLIDKAKGGRITREEALYLKRNDIARFKGELDRAAPWWRGLDPVRQRAVLNMTFNLGSGWITPGNPKAWPNTVALLKAGRYAEAADAIRANKTWVGQVGDRALRIAKQIETGK